MADGISREEKLAAGLKKLKQFQQQRSSKTKGSRKKAPSTQTDSSESLSESTPSQKIANHSPPEVPSSQSSTNDVEQLKTRISSASDINVSACGNEANDSTREGNNITIQKSKSDLQLNNTKEFSSTESLRQISLQVNGLMSETNAFMNGDLAQEESHDFQSQSLEKRNQELALLVNNLRQSNDQLQFQLQELKAKNKRQNQAFDQERKELQEKSHKEQVSLKDQLQVHIQTIGILVAEKTELQSSLSLSQQTAKQKAGEVEELQGRLRGSRQRASELERELNSLSNSSQQLDKNNKEFGKELERLKLDNYKISKSNEELKLANAELTEKLNKKINDLQALEKEFTDCRDKLSVAESRVLQLSQSDSNPENRNQLEEVYQEKLELEKRISHHKDSISKLIMERDQTSERYQQYISQLSQQVTSLRDEIKQHSSEKDQLSKERNNLQEKLDALQQQSSNISKEDPSELKVQMTILKNQLEQKMQLEVANGAKLLEELQLKDETIAQLEKSIARLKEEQVDKGRLVEEMQSDKVAASRAVSQNRELKKQLEELQSGFVEMSNDKLKVVEELDLQKHITKELGERLSQQEKELKELQDQLSQREEELDNLHQSSTKGIYQQNQIADRMRHYEAQGQLTEMLQKELHQAQEQINSLVNQNSELRMAMATQADVSGSDANQNEDKDTSKRNDLVASLSASVRQLEMERNQMMKQLEEQKSIRGHLEEQLKVKEIELHDDETGTGDVVSKKEYAMIKNAMTQLEERFKQTMSRIAELSDERQQLEHLVMQLQGETDTIGDYIALYQIQRGLMRKRASEKDEYIAQLARDREDLKAKLGELQNLVMRLLEERKNYQSKVQDLSELGIIEIPNISPDKKTLSQDSLDDSSQRETKVENDALSTETELLKKPEGTAKKIIDLLSEIESTNLVEKPVVDSFHPCPVCSGRLITV